MRLPPLTSLSQKGGDWVGLHEIQKVRYLYYKMMSPPTNGQGEESDRNWRDNFYNFVESLYHSKSYVAFVVSTMFQWIHSSPFFRCTVDKESKRHISVLIGKFSKQKIMMMIFFTCFMYLHFNTMGIK